MADYLHLFVFFLHFYLFIDILLNIFALLSKKKEQMIV